MKSMRVSSSRESFPRMWDQPYITVRKVSRHRIIPTYVGSTCILPTSRGRPPNHSHVCGINPTQKPIELYEWESFPRMWDQRPAEPQRSCLRRIIPTYVGSTLRQAFRLQRTPNHSHVCGINEPREPTDSCDDESFPRMWDQLRASLLRFRTSRIIPTYVGSTL